MKSRRRVIGSYNYHIALKFDRHHALKAEKDWHTCTEMFSLSSNTSTLLRAHHINCRLGIATSKNVETISAARLFLMPPPFALVLPTSSLPWLISQRHETLWWCDTTTSCITDVKLMLLQPYHRWVHRIVGRNTVDCREIDMHLLQLVSILISNLQVTPTGCHYQRL